MKRFRAGEEYLERAYWMGYWAAKNGIEYQNPYKDTKQIVNEYWHYQMGYDDYTPSLLEVRCPSCKKEFLLKEDNIRIQSCESGGIYGCYIRCDCGYKEEVF
jgi:hypothetical protein